MAAPPRIPVRHTPPENIQVGLLDNLPPFTVELLGILNDVFAEVIYRRGLSRLRIIWSSILAISCLRDIRNRKPVNLECGYLLVTLDRILGSSPLLPSTSLPLKLTQCARNTEI
jgi:hypothetical protein